MVNRNSNQIETSTRLETPKCTLQPDDQDVQLPTTTTNVHQPSPNNTGVNMTQPHLTQRSPGGNRTEIPMSQHYQQLPTRPTLVRLNKYPQYHMYQARRTTNMFFTCKNNKHLPNNPLSMLNFLPCAKYYSR